MLESKNDGKTEESIATQPRRDRQGNFIDAVRGRGSLHCNAKLGAATMVAIQLGVESYREQRTMPWDTKNERLARQS